MIKVALFVKRWTVEDVFHVPMPEKDRLIRKEGERDKILSPAEESRVLKRLAGAEVRDVRALVIALLDTGARVGEFIPQRPARPRRRGSDPEKATRKGSSARELEAEQDYAQRVAEREALTGLYRRVRWQDVNFASRGRSI